MLPIRLGTLNAKGAAGPLCLCADPHRPCRDDQLPYRQVAEQHRGSGVRAKPSSAISTATCSRGRSRPKTSAAYSSSTPGTWPGATPALPTRCPPTELRQPRRLLGRRRSPANSASRSADPRRQNVFVTRLHVRYDREHFPEDLRLPGDGRPAELPGTLCHPPPLERRSDLRRDCLQPAGARSPGTRGPATRQPDGLGHRRHPQQDHVRERAGTAGASQALVGAYLELNRRAAPAAGWLSVQRCQGHRLETQLTARIDRGHCVSNLRIPRHEHSEIGVVVPVEQIPEVRHQPAT